MNLFNKVGLSLLLSRSKRPAFEKRLCAVFLASGVIFDDDCPGAAGRTTSVGAVAGDRIATSV